ncbi:hypothetical protein SAMN04488005_3280 [Yoonia tamlensis]|uniref:Uncharacterized protein n=1 Tax=Yoonia tamlensis TaxID=390270 RepID=A0A1I6I5I5_9RHOB|nr:hypothetical protein [Yoonia tamlensis]SFR61640.1 hypothetical protein SAMN04488005_3280 [Yoonia tamlensis]
MKRFLIGLSLMMLGSAVNAKTATCLLVVDGEFYMNGTCEFTAETGGDFTATTQSDDGQIEWSASMFIEDGVGKMAWNGDGQEGQRMTPAGHQHTVEHAMKRDGACWANKTALLCAW